MGHFIIQELVDKETFSQFREDCWQLFPQKALDMLEGVREFFGVPITVNNWHTGGQFQFRGYRPKWYTGGASKSAHRSGMAFDCFVKGYTAEQARKSILLNQDHILLKEIQRLEGGVTWLHMDCLEPPQGKSRIYVFKG